MIGDIVQYLDGEKLITVVVVKVDGSCNVVQLEQMNGHRFNTTIEYLRPIPVYPVFLEKNGFEVVSESKIRTSYSQDIQDFFVLIKVDKTGIYKKLFVLDCHGEIIISIECKFVHELQNVLKVLKIKKQLSLP